jgi:hypothetical protein
LCADDGNFSALTCRTIGHRDPGIFSSDANLADAGFFGGQKKGDGAALTANLCHTSGNESVDDGVGRTIAIREGLVISLGARLEK